MIRSEKGENQYYYDDFIGTIVDWPQGLKNIPEEGKVIAEELHQKGKTLNIGKNEKLGWFLLEDVNSIRFFYKNHSQLYSFIDKFYFPLDKCVGSTYIRGRR